MLSIDRELLESVTGGADPRSKLLLDTLDDRFGSDGVVSFIGQPKFSTTRGGVSHARGKFDVNALWGGDTKYSFNAYVGHGQVTKLHTKVLGSE